MGEEEKDKACALEVGDIVRESTLIIPPDRTPWMGIVVYIEKDYYELYSSLGPTEPLIAVQWFQVGYVEALPASVLRLIQKANIKKKDNP
jgi:hypothetical protein